LIVLGLSLSCQSCGLKKAKAPAQTAPSTPEWMEPGRLLVLDSHTTTFTTPFSSPLGLDQVQLGTFSHVRTADGDFGLACMDDRLLRPGTVYPWRVQYFPQFLDGKETGYFYIQVDKTGKTPYGSTFPWDPPWLDTSPCLLVLNGQIRSITEGGIKGVTSQLKDSK
jgi:hypothetical protein